MPLEMVPLPCLGGKISLRASRLLMQRPSFILLDLEAKVEEKALRLKTLSFFKKKCYSVNSLVYSSTTDRNV